jgi:hypothetical protein
VPHHPGDGQLAGRPGCADERPDRRNTPLHRPGAYPTNIGLHIFVITNICNLYSLQFLLLFINVVW